MKTVLVDNSLCASALCDDAKAEDICGYIKALAAAGVKYVELDFRAIMKLRRLPEGIGYIFRAVDPMFLQLTEVFNFDYVLLTFSDLKKNMKLKVPIMLELPFVENTHRGVLRYAQSQIDGTITAVRFCDDFGLKSFDEMKKFVSDMKNAVPLPVDFCPRNSRKTALDCALKLTFADADSVTLGMARTNRFASLEEYVLTLLSVYDMIPRNIDIYELFGAAFYYKRIFRNPMDADFVKLLEMIDWDIRMLQNADTGERVKLNIALKNACLLKKTFSSALEKMIKNSDFDAKEIKALVGAIKHFDASIYSDKVLNEDNKILLN